MLGSVHKSRDTSRGQGGGKPGVAGDAPLNFVVNNFPDFWTTIKFGRFPISHLFFGVTHMTCELQVSFRSPFSKAILPSTGRSEILSPTNIPKTKTVSRCFDL